jgi:hypothetical protein
MNTSTTKFADYQNAAAAEELVLNRNWTPSSAIMNDAPELRSGNWRDNTKLINVAVTPANIKTYADAFVIFSLNETIPLLSRNTLNIREALDVALFEKGLICLGSGPRGLILYVPGFLANNLFASFAQIASTWSEYKDLILGTTDAFDLFGGTVPPDAAAFQVKFLDNGDRIANYIDDGELESRSAFFAERAFVKKENKEQPDQILFFAYNNTSQVANPDVIIYNTVLHAASRAIRSAKRERGISTDVTIRNISDEVGRDSYIDEVKEENRKRLEKFFSESGNRTAGAKVSDPVELVALYFNTIPKVDAALNFNTSYPQEGNFNPAMKEREYTTIQNLVRESKKKQEAIKKQNIVDTFIDENGETVVVVEEDQQPVLSGTTPITITNKPVGLGVYNPKAPSRRRSPANDDTNQKVSFDMDSLNLANYSLNELKEMAMNIGIPVIPDETREALHERVSAAVLTKMNQGGNLNTYLPVSIVVE